MDFSSYFQEGSESRSVGLGLSRRPPSAGQAPLAALRGNLGLDSCPVWQMCIYITCCGRAVCLDLLNEYYYYYYYIIATLSRWGGIVNYERFAASQEEIGWSASWMWTVLFLTLSQGLLRFREYPWQGELMSCESNVVVSCAITACNYCMQLADTRCIY